MDSLLLQRRMMMGQSLDAMQYFTITSTDTEFGSTLITFSAPSQYTYYYSVNNGATWSKLTNYELFWGQSMLIKGNGARFNDTSLSESFVFIFDGAFTVSGNIMSLCYGDNFAGQTTLPSGNMFRGLFQDSQIEDAEHLILPATTLTVRAYQMMFYGCTSLIKGPQLPATTLANYSYYQMFYGCTSLQYAASGIRTTTIPSYACYQMFYNCSSLQVAPELLATSLTNYAYSEMFYGCSSLVQAPDLPAQTLASYAYYRMFKGCNNLESAPDLPAAALVSNCYYEMFYGCSKINRIKCFATSRAAANNTTNWLSGVAANGTFTKASSASFWGTGASDIPTGWTVRSASGEKITFGIEIWSETLFFEADEGMTWRQWVDSEYNTYGFTLETMQVVVDDSYNWEERDVIFAEEIEIDSEVFEYRIVCTFDIETYQNPPIDVDAPILAYDIDAISQWDYSSYYFWRAYDDAY